MSASEQLGRWRAPNDQQEALRRRYVDHLAAHDDGVWRSCSPNHLTSSCLIMSDDRREVLLILHAKIGRWLQTGGHCEPSDTSLPMAALREAREESGIETLDLLPEPVWLSWHEVPSCGPIGPSHHLDVQFVATVPQGTPPILSSESLEVAWFSVDRLPEDSDESVRELVMAASSALQGSL